MTERTLPSTGRVARGFTLIEIMIVIAIILALGALIGINLFAQRDEAKKGTVQVQMQGLQQGLKFFRLAYDRYPTDQEGLAVLWSKETLDPEAAQDKWKMFVEKPVPNDGWGTPWVYKQISEHGDESTYDLSSSGPDKQEGTEDDITSWGTGAGGSGQGGDEPPPPPSGSSGPSGSGGS